MRSDSCKCLQVWLLVAVLAVVAVAGAAIVVVIGPEGLAGCDLFAPQQRNLAFVGSQHWMLAGKAILEVCLLGPHAAFLFYFLRVVTQPLSR